MKQEEILELQENILNFLTGSTADGSEAELIKILDNKTLSLSGKQIKALLALKYIFKNNKYVEEFIKDYLEFKKYNRTYSIILKGIELLSLYNFIKGRIRLNLNLSK